MGLVVSRGLTSQEPHFAAIPGATLVSVSMFSVKPKHAAGQQCQGEHWAQGAKKMRVSQVRESPPGRHSHPTLRGAPQGPGPQSSWKEGPPEPTGTEKQGACRCLPTWGPEKSLEWPPNQHGYRAPRCLPSTHELNPIPVTRGSTKRAPSRSPCHEVGEKEDPGSTGTA